MTQSKKRALPHIVKITETCESAISNTNKSCQVTLFMTQISQTLSQWASNATAAVPSPSSL